MREGTEHVFFLHCNSSAEINLAVCDSKNHGHQTLVVSRSFLLEMSIDLPSCCQLEISIPQLDFIANRIVKSWEEIVRLLGIEEYKIEQINIDENDSAKKAFSGLKTWFQSDKDPCCCRIFSVLQKVGRTDVIRDFKDEYKAKLIFDQTFYETTTNVPKFQGREDEIQKIRSFLHDDQQDSHLCIVVGLPGIGKEATIDQALKGKDFNRIVKPDFTVRDQDHCWGIPEILQCIIEKWQIVKNLDLPKNVSLSSVCKFSQTGDLLLLELAHINFDAVQFYRHITNTLKNMKKHQLKVIVTSFVHPPQINKIIIPTVVNINKLPEHLAISYLTELNEDLEEHKRLLLLKFADGNPFVIREIAEKTKLLEGHSNYSKLISSRSIWYVDMTKLFRSLERNAKIVLIQLVAFSFNVTSFTLQRMEIDMSTLNHLSDNLNMVKKISCGKSHNEYYVSDLIKTFILNYLDENREEETNELKKKYEGMKLRIVEYALHFIKHLGKAFYHRKELPKYYFCKEHFKHFKENCTYCLEVCRCSNSRVALVLFNNDKNVLLNSFIYGIKDEVHRYLTIHVITTSITFLRHCLGSSEIRSHFENYLAPKILDKLDDMQQAILCANFVFVKLNGGYCDVSIKAYVQELKMVVNCLERHKLQLKRYQLKCLYNCYVKLIYLQKIYLRQDVKHYLKCVKQIKLTDNIKQEIALFGVLADIGEHTSKNREKQMELCHQHFGIHPVTAHVIYLFAKCLENSGITTRALWHYEESKKMFLSLGLTGNGYVKCLFAKGKLLKTIGQKEKNAGTKFLIKAETLSRKLVASYGKDDDHLNCHTVLHEKILKSLKKKKPVKKNKAQKNFCSFKKYKFKKLENYIETLPTRSVPSFLYSWSVVLFILMFITIIVFIFLLIVNNYYY